MLFDVNIPFLIGIPVHSDVLTIFQKQTFKYPLSLTPERVKQNDGFKFRIRVRWRVGTMDEPK